MSQDTTTRTHLPACEGYNRWAPLYDREQNPLIALEAREMERRLGPVSGLDAIDLGCGTGRHALELAAAGARVTAVDFSEGMLAQARSKPGAANVRWLQADLTRPLPLDSGAFDLVVCALALEHVANLAGPFAEIARLCRPGGRILIAEMHPAQWLAGVSAHFHDPLSGEEVRPQSIRHTVSEFVLAALRAGLHIEDLAERTPGEGKRPDWPMLFWMELRPK